MPLDVKLTNPANPKDYRCIERAELARDNRTDPPWLKAEKQRRRGEKPAVTRAAPVQPAPAAQGKSMPALPIEVMTGLHPLGVEQRTVRAEFEALYDWVKAADAAPGRFTIRQEIKRDEIAARVDELRRFAFG